MTEGPDRAPRRSRLLAALVDIASEPIFALDEDGTIMYANAAAAAAVGRLRPHLLGEPFSALLELEGGRALRHVLDDPTMRKAELELDFSDVGRRAVTVQALPRIRPRTLAVTLVSGDASSSSSSSDVMRNFVRNAAHQLRTPLAGIAAAVEVLQSGAKEDPAERDRFLSHIETHAHRLIRIARGLLVLARAESGEQPPHEDVVVVLPILQQLVREARPGAGVDVSVECDPTLDAIANPDLVYEALAALVDNAVEHTRHGFIRLRACAANGIVSISVTDTAGGILPEHKERIFEPFYRPVAGADGFGLGLAIAAQAVHAMGGELRVDDTDGGSRFTVGLRSGPRSR